MKNLFMQCSSFNLPQKRNVIIMSESVYKVIELVGTSPTSWEDAVKSCVKQASTTLRDIRIVEVVQLDAKVDQGNVVSYRAKVKLSFKFEKE